MNPHFLAQCIASANTANAYGDHATAVAWCQKALQVAPNLPEAWYNLALAFMGQQDRTRAFEALKRTSELTAGNADAQNSVGLQFLEIGALPEAERCLKSALKLAPDFAFAHSNLGTLRERQNRLDEAESCFARAARLQPQLAQAHANLCGIRNKARKFETAEAAGRRAVELDPSLSLGWCNLAAALSGLGRHHDAVTAAQRAVELDAASPAALTNLGAALSALKEFDGAEAAMRKALELDAASPVAWSNLARVLVGLRRIGEAEAAARRAVEIGQGSADAWSALSAVLLPQRRFEDAEQAARKALQLHARSADAWAFLGAALAGMRKHEAAAAAARNALDVDTDHATAWYVLGSALSELRQYDGSIEALARAFERVPEADYLLGALFGDRMQVCQWERFETDMGLLKEGLAARKRVVTPFALLAFSDDPAGQRVAAEIFVEEERIEPPVPPVAPFNPGSRIRIGYYSADFRNHATSWLLAGVLEEHDRERFELVGFWFGPEVQDEMRERVSGAFSRFIDVRAMSDAEVAELSRSLGIHIAVDLHGHTANSRPRIFAHRAAPIQVNYLGFPGTSGMRDVDYIIGDHALIPDGARRHYSEKVVRLPHSYQPNDGKRRIADHAPGREVLGLPADAFVFACFNNNYKIVPALFDRWMSILKRTEGSVLWLLETNARAKENLRREARRRGVAPERLLFAAKIPLAEHLARISAADLFLDTWPCNAHTTASDALWAGLPVLTVTGESLASRVASSLLGAIGMDELVSASMDEYEERAVALAGDPERLAAIRQRLAANRLTTPLFDTVRYTRHLEAAFNAMYERAAAGLPPDHMDIPA